MKEPRRYAMQRGRHDEAGEYIAYEDFESLRVEYKALLTKLTLVIEDAKK